MIKKQFRLREKEVKKVLSMRKPFFSYNIVLNYRKNRLEYNRFSIVIGGKSVHTNVERNFFRRRFYDFVEKSSFYGGEEMGIFWYDFVFVVKKTCKLEKKNEESQKGFQKDVSFLFDKIPSIWKKF